MKFTQQACVLIKYKLEMSKKINSIFIQKE